MYFYHGNGKIVLSDGAYITKEGLQLRTTQMIRITSLIDFLAKRPKLTKVLAPVAGKLFPLEDVQDEIFASKGLGEGFAVKPESDLIYAPLDGVITSIFPTNHEIGIRTKEGLDLLIHLGLNTIELAGSGCDILVEAGQEVKKGQLLATMNRKLLRGLGYDDTVIVTYTNDQILKGVSAPVFFREINAKRAVQTISYH